ncbi:MAG: TlpA family protein disulfide reductase [Deltaproteobacteria bacterium]|nr:TlpA family protein disulfide reductase [Deltaproteobacteria bacterium]
MAVRSALVLLAACGATSRAPRAPVSAADAPMLPTLSFRTTSQSTWTSDGARGHVIVLDVWATYCKPCRKAFPKLAALSAGRPDLVVVGISVDDEDATVTQFLSEVPASFTIARDPTHTVETGPLKIAALPTVLVVDRQGRIRLRIDQMVESDYDDLHAVVDALRAE